VPGNDPQCRIDQDRDVEAEGADAERQLVDLPGGCCEAGTWSGPGAGPRRARHTTVNGRGAPRLWVS